MLNSAIARARRVRQDREGGFTLIELLIVIVILGVLASIVVFSVKGITDRGDTAACKADIATVQTAEEAYYAGDGTTALPGGSYGSLAQLSAANLLQSTPDTVAVNTTTGVVTGADGAKRKCAGVTVNS
ncbi:MAG: type II secretion system protein [Marmoricola sp.]